MRKKMVAGNWKMNKSLNEGVELADGINNKLIPLQGNLPEVVLCTPFIHLYTVSELLKDSPVNTGAQDCSVHTSGAYTGEVSAPMIKSTGASYVIIGHSERRSYHNEYDKLLNEKLKQALAEKLKVIFCCGEKLEEREAGRHFDVVKKQLTEGLKDTERTSLNEIVIAYEPVWAIGTGKTATSDQAQEMHNFIRGLIKEIFDTEAAENITILYGGSCNANNASELFSMEDVDGGLIGGASLKPDDFVSIINSFSK